MAELTEMKGQELVDIEEEGNELRLTFRNGKRYSLRVQEGRFVFDLKVGS
jgi:hypothetical protein